MDKARQYWEEIYAVFLKKRVEKQSEITQKKKELEEIDKTLDKLLALGEEWNYLKN